MARNLSQQNEREIRHFTTGVFDLVELPEDCCQRQPTMDDPLYYYRPWKTLLVRTVHDGGQSYYIKGDHRITIPSLWHGLVGEATSLADQAAGRVANNGEHRKAVQTGMAQRVVPSLRT